MSAAAEVNVLAILPSREDQVSLKQIFQQSKWTLHHVQLLERGLTLLDEVVPGVVISASRLPDGNWEDVLLELQRRQLEPLLIVTSRLADDGLWAEVLNRGGFDVLATPFRDREVTYSVSLAWRHWRDKLEPRHRRAS